MEVLQDESKENIKSESDLFLEQFIAGHSTGYEEIKQDNVLPIESAPKLTSDILQEDQPKKRGRKPGQKNKVTEENPVINSAFITGSLLLLLVDLLFPLILSFGNNYFDKKIKIKPEPLQMSNKQKADLEPLFDKIAQEINLNLSPLVTGLIAMVGIYGVNLIAARAEFEKEKNS